MGATLPVRRTDQRGQGAVEFALAMMVFMMLSMGIVDFARAFFTQETVQQAATAGARRAAVCQSRDAASPPTSTGTVDYAVYKSLFSLDWARTTITVSYEPSSATVGRQVTVTVVYDFNVATPLVGPMISAALGATPTLTGKATSTVEQVSSSC